MLVGVTFLRIDATGLGCVIMLAMTWMPVINPVSTILLITPFRRTLVNGFRRVCKTARIYAATVDTTQGMDHHSPAPTSMLEYTSIYQRVEYQRRVGTGLEND